MSAMIPLFFSATQHTTWFHPHRLRPSNDNWILLKNFFTHFNVVRFSSLQLHTYILTFYSLFFPFSSCVCRGRNHNSCLKRPNENKINPLFCVCNASPRLSAAPSCHTWSLPLIKTVLVIKDWLVLCVKKKLQAYMLVRSLLISTPQIYLLDGG